MPTDTEREPCCRRRGRPRAARVLSGGLPARCYAPRCCADDAMETVTLLPDEIELLKLIDIEGLEQEAAAGVLGVSRKTVWRDLHEARRKVTDALLNGKIIELTECPRKNSGVCPRENEGLCPVRESSPCPKLPGTVSGKPRS
ncbi:MAG: DUF134 domain-containing protein [Methanoregulaceae archaeon]